MPKITPCLWFDTQAEEAATFYVSVFANSEILGVTRFGEAGPGSPGTVLTADFVLDGQKFVALNGGPEFAFTEAVSFQVDCADQDEVDYFWDRLVDGGEESQCGWLKDKFGLSWQVVPTALPELLNQPDPDKGQAVMTAMLSMRKIDINALEAAAASA